MRRLGADLEEKQEPRGASVAEAQNGNSMKSSGRNLTLAAIEKRSVAVDGLYPVPQNDGGCYRSCDVTSDNRRVFDADVTRGSLGPARQASG